MNTYPAYLDSNLLSQKDWWLACFLAAMSRLNPADAATEADEALHLCNERWKNPPILGTWQYRHNYPIGHEFKVRESEPTGPSRPEDQPGSSAE